jgi:hypothetical protein
MTHGSFNVHTPPTAVKVPSLFYIINSFNQIRLGIPQLCHAVPFYWTFRFFLPLDQY